MPVKISRILHAGYIFECEGVQIAFDPIFENPFSGNCFAFPNATFDPVAIKQLQLGAVFISHYHDDHCSFESLNLLDRDTPIYVFCVFSELFSWIRQLGFKKVYSLTLDIPLRIGPFEVTPQKALDEEVDSIFHLRVAGLNILNVVDSWIGPSTMDLLANTAPWDLVLWPFQTMREIEVLSPSRFPQACRELPPEWIEQLISLKPRNIIPSSCQLIHENWSWYRKAFFPITYQQFEWEIGQTLPDCRVIRMNPSVSIELSQDTLQPSAPLSWVHPLGEQNVDYEYDAQIKPPTTAEIAQHFEALSDEKTQFVYEYCQNGLLQRYHNLGSPAEKYFHRPRHWRLTLYNQDGIPKHFHYHLNRATIELSSDEETPLDWTTEVPIAKLYGALEWGESLSSMYLRVNDRVFHSEIERELQAADLLEDPLIRCLFSGVFGAYQKAQFRKLTGSYP